MEAWLQLYEKDAKGVHRLSEFAEVALSADFPTWCNLGIF